MSKQSGKHMIAPIETEIERITLTLSEKEQRTNPALMKKMKKLRQKLSRLREYLVPNPLKLTGEY